MGQRRVNKPAESGEQPDGGARVKSWLESVSEKEVCCGKGIGRTDRLTRHSTVSFLLQP